MPPRQRTDIPVWQRHGECDGCGYCCEVIAHANIDFSGNDPAWIRARGLPADGMLRALPLVHPCPQLSEEKRCKIYEDRPKQCADFPQTPEEVEMAPCVYWFENLVTGEKKGGTRSPYPVEPPDFSKCNCGAGPTGIHSRWCALVSAE